MELAQEGQSRERRLTGMMAAAITASPPAASLKCQLFFFVKGRASGMCARGGSAIRDRSIRGEQEDGEEGDDANLSCRAPSHHLWLARAGRRAPRG